MDLVSKLETRFGKWRSNRMAVPTKNYDAPIPEGEGRIEVFHRANSPQSMIIAGQVLPMKGTDDLFKAQCSQ